MRCRCRLMMAGPALALALALPDAGVCQPGDAENPTLRGQVRLGGAPVPGVEVELHRASTAGSSIVQRTRTGPAGEFTFPLAALPRHGEAGDMYVAAVRVGGVLYSGAAVTDPAVLDGPYEIDVFDPIPAPPAGAPIQLPTRYLVAEPSATGYLVTDLFELAHDETHAWVADPDGGVTWRHPLPPGAVNIRVGSDEVAGEGVRIDPDGVAISTPLPPGTRQVLLQYEIPALDGLTVPIAGDVADLQFLVLEPAPPLEIAGLSVEDAVETETGLQYRRFVGVGTAGTVLQARVLPETQPVPGPAVALALAMMLAAAGIVLPAARAGTFSATRSFDADSGRSGRRTLLLEVARIDLRLDQGAADAEERLRLEGKRAALLGRIRNLP